MSAAVFEDAKVATMVKVAIDAMRKVVGGKGTNREWALASFVLLQHIMKHVLMDKANFEVNRAEYEKKLVELWETVKSPEKSN